MHPPVVFYATEFICVQANISLNSEIIILAYFFCEILFVFIMEYAPWLSKGRKTLLSHMPQLFHWKSVTGELDYVATSRTFGDVM